jgi:predicted transcriptional regulator of viral defense system
MPTAAYRALYSVAEGQMGYMTTAQAAAVGVRPMTLVMMTKRGALERASRGVYRLVAFPVQPLGRYMQATLWPYERPGVLSYETALFLFELSDFDPPKVHVTVPAEFRIQREIPEYLAIHHDDLVAEDVTRRDGIPITTPERTLRDCIRADLGPAVVSRAVREARRAGLLAAPAVAELQRQLRTLMRVAGDPDHAPVSGAERAKAARAGRLPAHSARIR